MRTSLLTITPHIVWSLDNAVSKLSTSYLYGFLECRGGDLLNLCRHGGREQQRLAVQAATFNDVLHLLCEIVVQDPVGLVKHEDLMDNKINQSDKIIFFNGW